MSQIQIGQYPAQPQWDRGASRMIVDGFRVHSICLLSPEVVVSISNGDKYVTSMFYKYEVQSEDEAPLTEPRCS